MLSLGEYYVATRWGVPQGLESWHFPPKTTFRGAFDVLGGEQPWPK